MAPYLRRCGYAQLEGDIIFLTALEREEHELLEIGRYSGEADGSIYPGL